MFLPCLGYPSVREIESQTLVKLKVLTDTLQLRGVGVRGPGAFAERSICTRCDGNSHLHFRSRRWRRALEPINTFTPTQRDVCTPHSPPRAPGATSCSLGWVSFPLPLPAPLLLCPTKDRWSSWIMRLVTDPYDFHSVDTDVSRNSKDFIGSTNGSLTSFLGIPFAKPPYPSLVSTHSGHVLTLVQYRKQAFPPS
jgi:hypothetical protein